MTTNFPSGLDSFTNPTATDAMDSATVPHADQHADVNDAVEALQAKVGVDGSAVTSSLDYQVANQGLVLVKSQTVGSGVSSVTVTGAFSSTFANYRVTVTGVSHSVASGDLYVSLGTATGWYGSMNYDNYTGVPVGVVRSNNYSRQAIVTADNTPTNNISFDIMNPYQAVHTVVHGQGYSGRGFYNDFGAIHSLSTSYSNLVIEASGTMSGGTIRVYGYNNG